MNIPAGDKVIIANLYGEPSSSITKKKEFVSSVDTSLKKLVDKYPTASLYVGGDINISLDKDSQVNINFRTMINNLGLVDCYRHLYPSVSRFRGYTRFPFKAQNSFPNRIDALFIPSSIAKNYKIKFSSHLVTSDHTLIAIKIRDKFISKNVTKQLSFKLYQLENEKYCDLFRSTILTHLKCYGLIYDVIDPTLHTPSLGHFFSQRKNVFGRSGPY